MLPCGVRVAERGVLTGRGLGVGGFRIVGAARVAVGAGVGCATGAAAGEVGISGLRAGCIGKTGTVIVRLRGLSVLTLTITLSPGLISNPRGKLTSRE